MHWRGGFLCFSLAAVGGVGATVPGSFLPFEPSEKPSEKHVEGRRPAVPDLRVLDQTLDALRVMQEDYFAPWLGTWPTSIDWTGAVMATHVAAALSTLSRGLELLPLAGGYEDYAARENLITLYFSQVLGYYFGQDAFAIRNEAYDDILWVVLGWLEAIEFIDLYTRLHDPLGAAAGYGYGYGSPGQHLSEALRNQTWYGNIWVPAFAHRARVFWDLADKGWDTRLCGGGMTWNPRLEPYKNAITNELFIAASASMYLYFPGDDNASPFGRPPAAANRSGGPPGALAGTGPTPPRNPIHLGAAVAGYAWLSTSGMTNAAGLYVDGFHISGWGNASDPNTRCDLRNDMVYTYNQGVVLTGLVGLWRVTGDPSYLRDGHRLVQAVIRATGYDLRAGRPLDAAVAAGGRLAPWRGLGRAGVLEEQCDASGTCSQNGQTFKGIFFHHLAAFCAPAADDLLPGAGDPGARDAAAAAHREACAAYLGWVRHNAAAALATRDEGGRFGMWWTAGLLRNHTYAPPAAPSGGGGGSGSVDYRNRGVPHDGVWVPDAAAAAPPPPPLEGAAEDGAGPGGAPGAPPYGDGPQRPLLREQQPRHRRWVAGAAGSSTDPNARGRGRTVETQGSGLALLRALWEMTSRYGH